MFFDWNLTLFDITIGYILIEFLWDIFNNSFIVNIFNILPLMI